MIVLATETVQCEENPRHNHLIRMYVGVDAWYSDHYCEQTADELWTDEGGEG